MPTSVVTVSQYSPQPAIQVDANSVFEVRGWYPNSFIAGDGVTPILGNSTSGEQGPYILVDSHLNASGYLVVPAHDVQVTNLSNPTSNYFEGLWIDGAFVQMLMPNNNVGTGWQIPSIYGSVIAIDEIALYNRAKRLLFPPDTFPTFEDVILLIRRLAGNFDYAAVDVNGITSLSSPPDVASEPIAVGDRDRRIVGTVYNVNQFPYYAAGNGTTDDHVAIQTALVAAGITGGIVYLPDRYNIGSVGLTVPSNVILAAPAFRDTPNLLYSGSGVAVDTYGAEYCGLQNLFVSTTNDAATGFRWGNASRSCWAENLQHTGTNVSTNTGTGFHFDGTTTVVNEFSGLFRAGSLYSAGNKYGISVTGGTLAKTWTSISLDRVTLVGRLDIAGSVGIITDTHSNLEGSVINGLVIEAFIEPFDWGNASGNYGFTILNMGNEGNTNTTGTFPFSWAGSVNDPHNGGYYQSASSNGLSNRWFQEFQRNGEWFTASANQRLHNLYESNGVVLPWGLVRGGSLINGELTRDKFIVSTAGRDTADATRNFMKLLEYKFAFSTAAPTDGSWGRGSQVLNSTPGVGLPSGWVCTASGTFKTALAGVTGSISINTRTLVVNSVSTMAVGDYISIVGVAGTKLIVAISAVGPTITIDSDSSASVSGQTVQYVTPTFQANDNLGTARGAVATSQFDTTTDVLADVPLNQSIMLAAGFIYSFVAEVYTSSNSAAGVKCAISGTTVPGFFRADATIVDSNAITGPSRATSIGSFVGNKTAVTAATIRITGTLSVVTGGTLVLQFAQNVANVAASSVLIGSTLETQLIG